jgi:hypothetical protein
MMEGVLMIRVGGLHRKMEYIKKRRNKIYGKEEKGTNDCP